MTDDLVQDNLNIKIQQGTALADATMGETTGNYYSYIIIYYILYGYFNYRFKSYSGIGSY